MREWIDSALRAPTRRLVLALSLGLGIVLLFVGVAVELPRHGLDFAVVGARVTVSGQPVVRLEGGGTALVPLPLDLTEDPSMLPDWRTHGTFMARQDALAALLAGPVRVVVQADGAERERAVAPPGPQAPPVLFWYQLFVGAAIYALSAWLWATAPRGWTNRLFFLAGLAMMLAAGSAAIYSTRELALPQALFRALGVVNELGAALFGLAIMTVMMIHPRRLLPRQAVALVWAVFLPWIALAVAHAVPGPELGSNMVTLLEMIAIAGFVAAQFVASQGDPVARAAVRWFGLGTVIGPGCFILAEIVPPVLGRAPLIDQGVAFGFFLVIVVGVFIGLRRDRLFAVDALSYAILYYALVAVALVGAEAAVLYGMDSPGESGGATTLLAALVALALFYLPLRDRLIERIGGRRQPDLVGALENVNRIAFLREPAERAAAWGQGLDLAFQPLGQEPAEGAAGVAVVDQGAAMLVPAVAGVPARRLRLAWRGNGLFAERDRLLAERLVAIAARADMERDAFERGVVEERSRVARDLHDDLAAHLMAGLGQTAVAPLHDTIRKALAEVRAIVSGRHNRPAALAEVLADVRAEAAGRLEIAGIALDWAPVALPGRLGGARVRALEASLREVVTNAIRHSQAGRVTVAVGCGGDALRLRIADDGRGMVPGAGARGTGNGLRNVTWRIESAGGSVVFPEVARGFCVEITMPVAGD